MGLWAWIPSLNPNKNVVSVPDYVLSIIGNDESENSHIKISSSTPQECIIDSELFKIKSLRISIVDGLLCIEESLDVFENNEGLSDVLYRIVKQAYHVDITHHGTECLGFVSAESKNEAVKQICATIVSGIYSEGSAKLYGSLPSASKSLERAGLIAYGSVYIEKYKNELGDDYIFYKELFGSLKQFHEVMYDRYRNEQVDRLSKVSAELNQNVSAMTKAVVVMTVISLMVAMSDIVVNEHGWISGAAYVLATILLSANVLLVMFTYSKKDHINTSSCSDSDGMSIQGFVAIIIALISMLGTLAFFIYYSISLIDILVNEFLFLTLLYNIMPYASKNDY